MSTAATLLTCLLVAPLIAFASEATNFVRVAHFQVPSVVYVGDTIRLVCTYDLGRDSTLYSLKWYWNDTENKASNPNGTLLVITDVDYGTAGIFKCEADIYCDEFKDAIMLLDQKEMRVLNSVAGHALKSRLIVFALQIIFNLVPDHDAGAFRSKYIEHNDDLNTVDLILQKIILIGLNRWDSHYFTNIAVNGYKSDDLIAFFPLYPLALRYSSLVIASLTFNLLHSTSVIMISAFILNLLSFILSSLSLYLLTNATFKNKSFAKETIEWYNYNPASIFSSANYSESTFAFLTFTGLWLLSSKRIIMAAFIFGLSSLTRSNAVLSIGFLIHKHFAALYNVWNRSSTSRSGNHAPISIIEITKHIALTLLTVALNITPFVAYQWYTYYAFCQTNQSIKLVRPDWCETSWIPYGAVQQKYWNQGFLRYYQLKQIPNFLLAAPIVTIVIASSMHYLTKYKHLWLSLGLSCADVQKSRNSLFNNEACFVYVVHAFALTIFGLLFIHVQVITRLLCASSPLLYWIVASPTSQTRTRMYKFYFRSYLIVGTFMFCNFLPWT